MSFDKEAAITKLESLRRIAGALHRDIEDVLEELKANQPPEFVDRPLASTQAPEVQLPYAAEPVSPTGQVSDAFTSRKAPSNVEVMQRQQLQPVRRQAEIHTPGRQPQPIGEAVEELLNAVEANAANQRGPKSPSEILTKYMSPAILRGGRGFVQPGFAGLKRYREVLLANGGLETSQLVHFPTGFYSATTDGQDEFFVATPNFFVLVYGLRSEVGLGVYLRANMGNMITQDEMSLGERLQLSNELEAVLSTLSE